MYNHIIRHNCEFLLFVFFGLSMLMLLSIGVFFRKRCAALDAVKQHYRNLADATFEGIIFSKNGLITDCNDRAIEITGYSREFLQGKPLIDLFVNDYHEKIRQNIASGYSDPYEVEGIRSDGTRCFLEVRGRTFRIGNDIMRASTMRDLTERRAGESLLRKLSAAVEHSPASIVITDLTGNIEYVNPAFTRLTGYLPEEVLGNNPRILKGGDQPEEFYREMWETIKRGDEWRGEFRNRRKDGTLFWEAASLSPILNSKNEITHFVAVKEDVTEKRDLMERLEMMAQFDMLTSLPNRRMFLDRLGQSVELARRNSRRFALLYVDLDGFKRINDTYGHSAGDKVLKTVAARLAVCIRMSDTAGRIGGDEFTVILGSIGRFEDAAQVAEKIITALKRPITLPDGVIEHIDSSIGISVFPDNGTDGDRLLAAADNAMFEAKRSGSGRYCYSKALQEYDYSND